MIAIKGVMISRDWLILWVLLGLLALSLSDLKRWLRGVLFDWLPFIALLLCYDLSHWVSQLLPMGLHVYPQIDADRLLFGSPVPTVRLQHWLYVPGQVHWYDLAAWGVYMTHFFATLLVAAALWRFAYPRFRQFRTLVLTLAGAGFVTYVLFPAVPPWLASQQHQLAPLSRVVEDVWQHVGLQPATALFENHGEFYNQVAAVPSLHAAFPMLFLLFFWSSGWRVRIGLGAYVLAMAFTLVYSGEHYIFDVLLGWSYAGASYAAVAALARRRRERRHARRPLPARGAELAQPGAG